MTATAIPGPASGEPIETVAISTQLVVREDVSKPDGAELARWVRNGRHALAGADVEASIFPAHETEEGLRAHDGIYAFATRETAPFFERNGDLIYLGVAAMGALASLIGAIVANIRSTLRDGGLRFLSRLETLTKELREAETPERVYRIADTGLELAQAFARDMAARKVESRIDLSFQMLYTAFRSEVAFKLDRGAQQIQTAVNRAAEKGKNDPAENR
jgi:hypothetical protein